MESVAETRDNALQSSYNTVEISKKVLTGALSVEGKGDRIKSLFVLFSKQVKSSNQ